MQITSPLLNFNGNISKAPSLYFKGGCSIKPADYIQDRYVKPTEYKEHFHASEDVKLYKLLPKPIRDLKYKTLDKETKREAFNSIIAGNIVKKIYDEKYGKENYVFVSIGTSPAGVGRTLEFMGQDVRYMPISGIRHIGFPVEDLCEYQDYDKYSKFLDEIGLNRRSMKENGKKYIFCDYTKSGATLNAVEYYAKHSRFLPEEQIEFHSLNDDLAKYAKTHKKTMGKVIEYVESLCSSRIAKYTGVPHLNCMVVDNIEQELKKPKTKISKDFNFAMLYMLDREGLLA